MSTKPSATTGWTGGTTIEPPAGKKTLGWLNDERPPPQYMQWLFERIELWLQYLSDGALELAATTFSGLVTAQAGLTASANQNITVSGTGDFKHGDRVKTVSAWGMQMVTATDWLVVAGGKMANNGTGSLGWFAVPFDVGDRIKSITFALEGDGAGDITVGAITVSTTGAETSIGGTTVNNQANGWADTTVNVTDTTITDSLSLVVICDTTGLATKTGITVGNIRITYDRP